MSGSARWRQIEALFEGALEREAGERESWLALACGDDATLFSEVAAMLRAHESSGGILDRDAGSLASAVLRESGSELGLGAARVPLPRRIGPYRVEGEAGRGGMGVVYKAFDERLQRPLALKVLPTLLHADDQVHRRFLTEARAVSALEHPAICTVYDVGETDDGRMYIAMAYYPGRTLEQRLAEGPVELEEALDWIAQAAEGLGRAHDAGIVHRDVKPANLLLTDDGRIKLLDFGVAKLETATFATPTGTRLGTPSYMAPEQASGGAVDRRTDLFSLGAVLHELLTGSRPFRCDNFAVALHSVLHDDPPPISRLRPGVPPSVDVVVARCLAKDPARRFGSAGELVAALVEVRRALTEPATAPAPEAHPELPAPLTRFVGREREIRQVMEALRQARLVTLTGPGGTGKTRLALETAAVLAAEMPGGVHFVPLASVAEPDRLVPAVCAALGVPETAALTAAEALIGFLGDRSSVLVLDNLEQVVEAAPRLVELLARCPGLRVLATSRTLLRVSGERVIPVPPLDLPEPGTPVSVADLERYSATTLFLDRARAAAPQLAVTDELAPVVVEICRRLDGLPLAIELAAARVRHFGPKTLLTRLDRRLDALGTGPRDIPERHQTLRHAVSWSHDLLAERERVLFRRLAVFVDGFTTEAAEEVAGAGLAPGETVEGLATLLDHSLLRRVAADAVGEGERHQMLETIRELAAERLEASGEHAEAVAAHTRFFVGLAEEAEGELTGPEQACWLDALGADHGNFRSALDRTLEGGDTASALRLGAAVWRFWLVRGHLREGRAWMERLAALPEAPRHPELLARVLHGLGTLANNLGDNQRALEKLEESLALYREMGDRAGLAVQLNNLAWVAAEVSELERARELSEEALRLHRELSDRRGEALALNNLGWVAIYRAEYPEARSLFARSLALRRELGDRRGTAFALANLAWAEERTGLFGEAAERLREAEGLLGEVDDRMLPGQTLNILGLLAYDRGEMEEALEVLGRACASWRESGNISGLCLALSFLAQALLALGRLEEAEAAAKESEDLAGQVTTPWGAAGARLARARVLLARGDVDEAVARACGALTTFHLIGDRRGATEALETLAVAAARRGRRELGARLMGAATAHRQAMGAPPRSPEPGEDRHAPAGDLAAALEEGRGLTLDQAFLLAMESAGA